MGINWYNLINVLDNFESAVKIACIVKENIHLFFTRSFLDKHHYGWQMTNTDI